MVSQAGRDLQDPGSASAQWLPIGNEANTPPGPTGHDLICSAGLTVAFFATPFYTSAVDNCVISFFFTILTKQ